jgi:hypothetical protein
MQWDAPLTGFRPKLGGAAHDRCGKRLVVKPLVKLVEHLQTTMAIHTDQLTSQFIIANLRDDDRYAATRQLMKPLFKPGGRPRMDCQP